MVHQGYPTLERGGLSRARTFPAPFCLIATHVCSVLSWSVPLIIITMTDGDTLMADELINRMAKPEFFGRPDRRTLR